MAKTGPNIEFTKNSGAGAALKRLAGLAKLSAYVGVPSKSQTARKRQLLAMAGDTNSKKKKEKLKKAAESDVTNAQLLFIHTKGSPVNNIPPRPILQPAVEADGNRQRIARELAKSIKKNLQGDRQGAKDGMLRTALAAQNAARAWFTDPRNNWAPNKEATIEAKGSDRPLIDTGALRNSIVGIVKEE